MQAKVLDIVPVPFPPPMPEIVLSFGPFIEYLRKRKDQSDCHKSKFFSYVIEEFERHPELLKEMKPEDVEKYADQLQLIYLCLSPIVENEEDHYWAISMPIRPVLLYSTNALYRFVQDMFSDKITSDQIPHTVEDIKREKLEYNYSFILERLYGMTNFLNRYFIHSIVDKHTGLTRYFKQKLDTRFIEITTLRELPELNLSTIKARIQDSRDVLPLLQELLPLDMFRLEGFGIASVEEVTPHYALENIKTLLLDHSTTHDDDYYSRFTSSLKSLIGTNDVEFGALPFLEVNHKPVFIEGAYLNSILINSAKEHGTVEKSYSSLAEEYAKKPKVTFIRDIMEEDETRHEMIRTLKAAGVRSFAMLPVYFNNSLVGAVEVYTKKPGILDEALLSKMEPAMPLVSQLLKNTIDQFNDSIDKVIKEKFTAVQPSVQWKFTEVAWHYLQNEHQPQSRKETEDIVFEDVYPLYGAVDIRNSTVERNMALRKDLRVQFKALLSVLVKLKDATNFGLLDEKIFVSQQWLAKIEKDSGVFNQEIKLNEFLENDMIPFLLQFIDNRPDLTAIADEYFEAINERHGAAYENRRALESSMTTVISSVNNYFEMLKDEIQQAYPCYFEKFRTDGVEYDIYIGQSITPNKPYSNIYLKNLRLMQLTSMAAIARYSNSLLPHLSRQVETTQLIFIHSHPIDIRFRKDEKRFDVEGAYNIRYHIIKKRIDKVNIKDTRERLTQPNKIALVYFNQKEADEYISYIRYLQGEKLLNNDLEYLELEELQGVSGLKALRVGVNLAAPEKAA
ncbi:MAG: GAF domain-containing protein [Citrobacter freundii]|nr:MAG: GAF domain-containing protein [Citrobacter freundii]